METIILGNDFFAFYKFPLPSNLLLPPLLYRCSGVPALFVANGTCSLYRYS